MSGVILCTKCGRELRCVEGKCICEINPMSVPLSEVVTPTLSKGMVNCMIEETPKIYNTDVETKKKYWKQFASLIEEQFIHGGDKYAMENQEDKEATDWVCEICPGQTGVDWILGTMAKYIARYKTFQREKEFLKIATYCYIAWLKKGYHLQESHDKDTKR